MDRPLVHLLSSNYFWQNAENSLLLNPRLTDEDQTRLQQAFASVKLTSSVGLLSSGTESQKAGAFKIVVLPKAALLAGAQSVNDFFALKAQDTWLNPLPLFHVGGLSILARAHLSGASVHFMDAWDVDSFVKNLEDYDVRLTSIVPTQVYDLVKANRRAPSSLKFIFVGGGALDKNLYLQARQLGWPLIPSYGMTETSAMLAAAPPDSLNSLEWPQAEVFPQWNWQMKGETRWAISGPALFSHYIFVFNSEIKVEEQNEAFILDDHLIKEGPILKVMGRESELIKILGESVNLNALAEKISRESWNGMDFFIRPLKDERKGYRLQIVTDRLQVPSLESINEKLMPYERIDEIYQVAKLPRSPLGKILKSQIH